MVAGQKPRSFQTGAFLGLKRVIGQQSVSLVFHAARFWGLPDFLPPRLSRKLPTGKRTYGGRTDEKASCQQLGNLHYGAFVCGTDQVGILGQGRLAGLFERLPALPAFAQFLCRYMQT